MTGQLQSLCPGRLHRVMAVIRQSSFLGEGGRQNPAYNTGVVLSSSVKDKDLKFLSQKPEAKRKGKSKLAVVFGFFLSFSLRFT